MNQKEVLMLHPEFTQSLEFLLSRKRPLVSASDLWAVKFPLQDESQGKRCRLDLPSFGDVSQEFPGSGQEVKRSNCDSALLFLFLTLRFFHAKRETGKLGNLLKTMRCELKYGDKINILVKIFLSRSRWKSWKCIA